jgi:hypothetical protein
LLIEAITKSLVEDILGIENVYQVEGYFMGQFSGIEADTQFQVGPEIGLEVKGIALAVHNYKVAQGI